jgi:hypothetical protein
MSDSMKLKTKSELYVFKDPDGKIYQALRNGADVKAVLLKYANSFEIYRKIDGNMFLNEGINYIWQLVSNPSGLTPFGSNTCIGVGDGNTPVDPTQTGLQGSNKAYKTVDAGYPQVSGNTFTVRATFGTSDANFPWNEWTVANSCSDDGINLNRKVESLGAKNPNTTWVLQLTLSIS